MSDLLVSRWFRLLLWSTTLLALGTAGAAIGLKLRADRQTHHALNQAAASLDAELALERLGRNAADADFRFQVFLTTWNARLLDLAVTAHETVRADFEAVRGRSRASAVAGAEEMRELESWLDSRVSQSRELRRLIRAGQIERLRERAATSAGASEVQELVAALRERETAERQREQAELQSLIARSKSWSYANVAAVGVLSVAVATLLWHFERARRLVVLCAWTRTVQYGGAWLSFEEYLERRFGLHTSHGLRPDQMDRARSGIEPIPEREDP